MKTITITIEEYDKLKADAKQLEIADALLGQALGAMLALQNLHPNLQTLNKIIDDCHKFLLIKQD
jgi:hypothetical protein